jgi:hypothetical protein
VGGLQIEFLAVDPHIPPDPIDTHRLDLAYLWQADLGLMRKVESKFCWRDQRALLVDMISENLSQTEVENVGRRVVVP